MDKQPVGSPLPQVLERVRTLLRVRHFSRRTEQAYVGWIRRFIMFHGKGSPDGLGAPGVEAAGRQRLHSLKDLEGLAQARKWLGA